MWPHYWKYRVPATWEPRRSWVEGGCNSCQISSSEKTLLQRLKNIFLFQMCIFISVTKNTSNIFFLSYHLCPNVTLPFSFIQVNWSCHHISHTTSWDVQMFVSMTLQRHTLTFRFQKPPHLKCHIFLAIFFLSLGFPTTTFYVKTSLPASLIPWKLRSKSLWLKNTDQLNFASNGSFNRSNQRHAA